MSAVSGVEQVKSVSVQTLTLFPGFQVLLWLSLALLGKHEILWPYFVVTFAVYNVSYIKYYFTLLLRWSLQLTSITTDTVLNT